MLENVATRDWEECFRSAKREKSLEDVPLKDHLSAINNLEAIIEEKDQIIEDLLRKGKE